MNLEISLSLDWKPSVSSLKINLVMTSPKMFESRNIFQFRLETKCLSLKMMVEQMMVGQMMVEQMMVGQIKVEQMMVGQIKVGQMKVEQMKVEQMKVEKMIVRPVCLFLTLSIYPALPSVVVKKLSRV